MLISYDDNRVEELIAYNQLCNLVAKQHDKEESGKDKIFTFCHIVDHKGPLKPGDSEYNGSHCNIKIEWEDAGVATWEPLTVIGKCNPVTCAVCAKEHGLLNKPGWKQFKKSVCKAKTLQCLVNNAKQVQRFGQIVYKFGVCIPCNEKEAMMLGRENGNAYWQDAIEAATGQLFEYKSFKDLGKNAAVPKGYQLIKLLIIFDVKQSVKWKARIIACGDMTDSPHETVHSGVASLQSLCNVCLLVELNGLKLTGGDVQNTYLEAYTSEKVCVCLLAELNGLKLTGGDVGNTYLEAHTSEMNLCLCWS